MKNIVKITLVAILFVVSSCGTSNKAVTTKAKKITKAAVVKKADPFVGTWSLVIAGTPQGDMAGKMKITKADNKYAGVLSTPMGDLPFSNFKIVDGKLSGGFDVQGLELNLSGTFKGDTFTGAVSGMGESFTTTGKKE